MVDPLADGCQAPFFEKLKMVADDLDPEIKAVVVELTRKGYQTILSCAGHPGLSGFRDVRGYIWFDTHLNKTELISELKTFNLNDVRVEWDDGNGETTIASFAPIGIPKRFSDFGSLIFSLALP